LAKWTILLQPRNFSYYYNTTNFKILNIRITVVGLGYVGLPLAVEFGKKIQTFGFDINAERISELRKGYDRTGELSKDQIEEAKFLSFSTILNSTDSKEINPIRQVYIVTVPTPIDSLKNQI
jgi:UDP-N-acetyl-D-glucosamine/UDP-N-acetyl-D-galactosamine dehydrogenase